jgi:hypothetical protein
MAKLKDDEWLIYGRPLTDSLAEVVGFERKHEAEFQELKVQRDALLEKSDRLAAKINEAEDDLVQLKAGLFADLSSKAQQFASRAEAAERLDGKAKSIAGQLHDRGVALLKMRLEKNGIDQEAAIIAQRPYMARHEMAIRFFDALVQVAGIGLTFSRGVASFDFAGELARQAADLRDRLSIASGGRGGWTPMPAFGASSPAEVLGFAEALPEKALPALVSAWRAALTEDAVRVQIRYISGVLSWSITSRRAAERPVIFQTHDNAADKIGRAEV